MPKFFQFMIAGHYLYFTSACIIEALHAHASDKKLTRQTAAKFFIRPNGDSVVQKKGNLTSREITIIQKFIKANYIDMYNTWKEFGGKDFYRK